MSGLPGLEDDVDMNEARDAMAVLDKLAKAEARIQTLERALRRFAGETNHHAIGCGCRYCCAAELVGETK